MTIYLHDGSTNSQPLWTDEALDARVAAGAIISPFFSPLVGRTGQLGARDYADRIRAHGGDVLFDATTHGVGWPGTSNWVNYNTWQLWAGARGDLAAPANRADHFTRVFAHQILLGAPHLAPTIALDNAIGADADRALAMADEARALVPTTWQSLAGRRGFWLSPDLDTHVGSLQQLRAPVWVLTHIREAGDYPADFSETAQTEAFCRTVDSLSRRSRVIVAHADMAGLPAIAAGADTIGTGWHTKQRLCSTTTYEVNSPGTIRRQAIWYTYEGLIARLHRNENTVLKRFDLPRATRLYAGAVLDGGRDRRLHHLEVVSNLVDAVVSAGSSKADRVATLRVLYENAGAEFNSLAASLGRVFVQQRSSYLDGLYEGLKGYGQAEGFWAP